MAACDDFVVGLCDALMACNPDLSEAECFAAIDGTGLDCTCARAYDEAQLTECFDVLGTSTCADLAEDNVPPACDGMFTLQC